MVTPEGNAKEEQPLWHCPSALEDTVAPGVVTR
jgi:hypothetical protein